MTPMIADDFSYCFSWVDSSRITSPLQIPASMAVHRVLTNGRVVAHGLVQLILLFPKLLFNVLNAANAVLLMLLFRRFFQERKPSQQLLLLLCAALLIWNELPAFGQVVLWLDGAINYSWGISLFLLFLWPYVALYRGLPRKTGLARDLLFFLCAFAAGAYSENGSLAAIFIAAVLTAAVLLREKKLLPRPLAGLLAAGLGYVFLFSAPAMSGRSAGADPSAIAKNLALILRLSWEHLLPLFLLFAAALTVCLLVKADRRQIFLACVLFCGGIGSLSAFIFAAYFTERHFCFTVFFTVLAVLVLFSALLEQGRRLLPSITAGCLAMVFLFQFPLGALDIAVTFRHARQRQAQIDAALAAGETEVYLEVYNPATPYSAAYRLEDLNLEETNVWPNWSLADYYGLEKVHGVLTEPAE